MDPLSITAATVTFVTVVANGLRKLKQIYGASSELAKLTQDVSELGLVLQAFGDALSERLRHRLLLHSTTQALCDVVSNAKQKLQKLQALIDDKLTKPSATSTEPKVARRAWLKFKSDVDEIQRDLRESRDNLTAICEALNLTDGSKIQGRLDDLLQWQDEQRILWTENTRRLQELSIQIAQSIAMAQAIDQSSTSSHSSGSPPSLASSISSTPPSSATTSLYSSGDDSPAAPTSKALIPRRLSDSIIPTRPSLEDEHRRHSTGHIRAARYRRSYCDGWCSCICHKEQHFQTPRATETVTGHLFFGYSGFPGFQQRCSERNCRQQSVPIIKFLYHFPPWLCLRAIRIAATFSYMNGPQVALSMPRVVPGDAKLFDYAVQGNLDGIKALFNDGKASPYDVASSNGRTALHYAVVYNHLAMSRYLIDKGADSKLEDKGKDSTVALAWGRIFGNLADASTTDTWRCMFEDEDFLECRAFPPLHKIILNLNGADLREQLEQSTVSIDDRDLEGRTALSWAATRCNTDAVKVLLEFNADANVNSNRNTSPLQFAAQSHSAEVRDILEALLAAGAHVDNIDTFQRTALTYACCNQPDPDYVKPLIDRDPNLNTRDCWGRTPLGYAAKMGHHRTVKYLLSCGADPLIADDVGYSPHFEAIEHNHHEVLRALRGSLALCDSRAANGRSLIHTASIYGDVGTFSILAGAACLFADQSDTLDSKDMLEDAFNQRQDFEYGGDLFAAFQAFICALSAAGAIRTEEGLQSDDSDEGSEDGEFEDASEF